MIKSITLHKKFEDAQKASYTFFSDVPGAKVGQGITNFNKTSSNLSFDEEQTDPYFLNNLAFLETIQEHIININNTANKLPEIIKIEPGYV